MPSFGSLNRVNTNLQSMEARFSLNKINRDLADNQIKLATGLRINRAEDDAAGFSIASKLSSRIGGLEQALRNVGDAKSVLDIAESSINNVMDILIEMKSKAVQAANDTLGDEERKFIEDQIESLGKQINKIADQTVFQDARLLMGEEVGQTVGSATMVSGGSGKYSMTFQVGERGSDTLDVQLGAITTFELFKGNGIFSGATASDTVDGNFLLTPAAGSGFASVLEDPDSATHFNLIDGSATGAAALTSAASAGTFRNFIGMVDDAITKLSSQINEIGIVQSSLSIREETLSQQITSNNSARGSIMDTDFAKAQSESIRLQILQQTATAALAQANMGPQAVLNFIQ